MRPVAIALLVVGAIGVAIGVVVLVADRGDDSADAGHQDNGSLRALVREAAPASQPFPGLTETDLGVGGRCLHVVVADEEAERVQGLRGRSDLGSYDGMLFAYEEPVAIMFTMSTVPVALDIGFYGADGAPVSRRHMTPCPRAQADCPSYSAGSTFQYALETLSGDLPSGELSPCR